MSTLSYEVAKRLDQAGFPQGRDGKFIPIENADFLQAESVYYSPSLSELIRECGERFVRLQKDATGWAAVGRQQKYDDPQSDTILCGGPTPKIAVANLFISLHGTK